jgi:hypothetical protein
VCGDAPDIVKLVALNILVVPSLVNPVLVVVASLQLHHMSSLAVLEVLFCFNL